VNLKKLVALIAASSLAACGGYVPPPQPPAPTRPSPMCKVGTDLYGCWVEPTAGKFEYVCAVRNTPGGPVVGTKNVLNPALCPQVVVPAPVTSCPKDLAPDATLSMANKSWGQGWDSTLYVTGDPDLCEKIHGVRVNRCHLEGWPKRLDCELELLGKTVGKPQACPVWEYAKSQTGYFTSCVERAGDPAVTCDHFGTTALRDDPATDVFEGYPTVCSFQRDPAGDPTAGFFMIAHGTGYIRACLPNHTGCADPIFVDW
jgi:hypothetical protein